MYKIDAHIHFVCDHPEGLELLEELELKCLNVCVAHNFGKQWRNLADRYRQLSRDYPERYAWRTAFDVPDGTSGWTERVIAQLSCCFMNQRRR